MSSFSKHMREANAKLKNKLFGEAQSQKQPVLAPAPGYCKHCKQYTIEEPVQCSNTFGCRCPKHYTTPPQRKPLPASDIVTMYDEHPMGDSDMIEFARAIERAHGIGGQNE